MKDFLIKLLTKWLKKLAPWVFSEKQVEDNNKDTNPIKDVPVSQDKENYWNTKWKTTDIIYYGRQLKQSFTADTDYFNMFNIPVDVKSFILDNDAVLKHIIKKFNLLREDMDEQMLVIQQFVCSNKDQYSMEDLYADGSYKIREFISESNKNRRNVLEYIGDSTTSDSPEYWQYPFETLAAGFGDCEDGAILIAALAINAGIPSYRVKVAAGTVTDRWFISPNAPSIKEVPLGEYPGASEGGHAYCIYLASDDEWRVIDWCWHEDSNTSILEKPLAKLGGFHNGYLDTWFTFNNQFAWNQKELDINTARLDKLTDKKQLTISK